MRRSVYPGLVARKKMKQASADRQIDILVALAEYLRAERERAAEKLHPRRHDRWPLR